MRRHAPLGQSAVRIVRCRRPRKSSIRSRFAAWCCWATKRRSCSAPSIGWASATAATTPFAKRWPKPPARRSIASPCTRCINTTRRRATSTPRPCWPRGRSAATLFHVAFARQTIDRAAAAVRHALSSPKTVTHLGVGVGQVEKVASNRRVLGEDGKVKVRPLQRQHDPRGRGGARGRDRSPGPRAQSVERRSAAGRVELLCHASAELLRPRRRELRLRGHGPRSARVGACRACRTFTSTAPGATWRPASTTTARRPIARCWPRGWPRA